MVVVREVFQIHPEKMKDALSAIREGRSLIQKLGVNTTRALTDLTGEYYTLVMESEFPDFGSFEKVMGKGFADPAWQAWYGRLRPAIRGGRREVWTLLD